MESKLGLQEGDPETIPDRTSLDRDRDGLRVKVALRIRPLIKRDMIEQVQIAIQPDMSSNIVAWC